MKTTRYLCLFLSFLMLFGAIFALNGCAMKKASAQEAGADELAHQMPPCEGLEFWIGEDVTDFDFSDYDFSISTNETVGPRVYGRKYEPYVKPNDWYFTYSPEQYVLYQLADYAGKTRVVGITITDPEVTVYGFNAETPIDEIFDILADNGYTIHRFQHSPCIIDGEKALSKITQQDFAEKDGIFFECEQYPVQNPVHFSMHFGCSLPEDVEYKPEELYFLKEAPTELEFDILQNVTDYDFSDYWYGPGEYYGKYYFGTGYCASNDSRSVLFQVGGYPDAREDKEKFIVSIDIWDPEVNVYGFHIGTPAEEISTILENLGYTITPPSPTGNAYRALKGHVRFIYGDTLPYILIDTDDRFVPKYTK